MSEDKRIRSTISFVSNSTWASIALSFAIALALYAGLAGDLFVWDRTNYLIVPTVKRWLFLIAIVVLPPLCYAVIAKRKISFDERGFAFALLVVFAGDWLTRRYNLLQGPEIRGEIILGFCLSYLALRVFNIRYFLAFLPLASVVCLSALLSATSSSLIFSDDHPAFIYRLTLLKAYFPEIPFYDVLWNGGYDVTQVLSTGAHNVFLLMAPLIYFFPVEEIYNLIVGLLLFAVLPLSVFTAARYEKIAPWAAGIAGVLAMTSSLFWYRWALKYGTLGFICSSALFPLVFALVLRAIDENQKFRLRDSALFIIATSLMLCWTPMSLAFAPLAVITLWKIKAVWRNKRFVTSLLLIAMINLPWIYTFVVDANVFSFVKSEQVSVTEKLPGLDDAVVNRGIAHRHKVDSIDLKEALSILRETAVTINPLILLFVIPGACLFIGLRKWAYLATVLHLVVLGSIFVPIKPQLELDRMLVLLAVFASLPVALFVQKLHERIPVTGRRWYDALALSLVFGFLFAGIFSTSAVARNRSLERYSVMRPWVKDLQKALTETVGKGRYFFSGFVLHELSGGHLAPLSVWSGVPLVASSHVHNQWRYKSSVPPEFLNQGEGGIEEFFHQNNVSATVAHEPFWISYFEGRKNIYTPVGVHGKFHLYSRTQYIPGYFYSGEGEIIKQSSNGVEFKLKSKDAILRFAYEGRLAVRDIESGEDVCAIEPHPLTKTFVFVSLKDCPVNRKLKLYTPSLFRRFLR